MVQNLDNEHREMLKRYNEEEDNLYVFNKIASLKVQLYIDRE